MNPVIASQTHRAGESDDPRLDELLDRIWSDRSDEEIAEALKQLAELLPTEDGIPMESPWHRAAVNLLIAVLTYFWRDRKDFYVGGNMFVYYFKRPQRHPLSRGPDFFYVAGVERDRPRDKWIHWDEAKFPHVIIELLSPSTAGVDRTTKKDIYEQEFETDEYYLYDPAAHTVEGWRLNVRGEYEAIAANDQGWLWSERLQMWLGNWTGKYLEKQAVWPRFYDREGNLVLHEAEGEKKRANALETELEQLRKKLADLERGPENG